MIYFPLSNIQRSREMQMNPTASPAQEGQSLVRSFVGQTFGAAISTGAAGENFLGFLVGQTSATPFLQTTAVKTETLVLSAGKTITLSKTPIASTTLVYNVTTGAVAAPNSVTGAVVDLTTAGVVGNTYLITYRYTLTVLEARTRNGDVIPGGYAGLTTGTMGVIQAGTVYIDQFDTSKDWSAATSVKLSTGGLVTDQTGSGTVVNSSIIQTPSVDFPFLGIEFAAY